MSEIYVQCLLNKEGQYEVAWIPQQFAVKSKVLKIKDRKTGIYENGWIVVETYAKETIKNLTMKERDYLLQRRASDV